LAGWCTNTNSRRSRSPLETDARHTRSAPIHPCQIRRDLEVARARYIVGDTLIDGRADKIDCAAARAAIQAASTAQARATGPNGVPGTHRLLERAGYQLTEIAAAGILADARWPDRLCGAWRDHTGRIGTLWARTLDDTEHTDTRYLYLKGATRTNLPPYGLSDLPRRSADARRDLVLVEGLIDVHQLRAHGIENVAALGGTSISPHTFEQLHRHGIETVTLCLDNDDAGRVATARAIENLARAGRSPDIYVTDPAQLAPANDPDELVRQRGVAAWGELANARSCGIAWRAHQLVAVSRDAPLTERRAALARAGRWLGTLPPRLALEQEDALRSIAKRCGYSTEAVERAFHARYWDPPQRIREPARSPSEMRALSLER
jgi:DNA primase